MDRDRPQLWVPARGLGQERQRLDRPGLIRYATLVEIDPHVEPAAALVAKLAKFDREQVLAIVSNVSARLHFEGHSAAGLHAQLERDLVSPALRQKLHAVRSSEADLNVVFTRRALLLVGKSALGLRPETSTSKFDEREIGECVLLVNALLDRKRDGGDDQLMMDTMADWDLNTSVDPPHVMARFRRIFDRLFTSTHPAVITAREQLSLSDLLFDGLTYAQFQMLLYAIFVIVEKAVADRNPPVLRIEPPLPTGVGEEPVVRAFFTKRSHPLEHYGDWKYHDWTPERLRELLTDDFFLHDETSLRQKPFIAVEDRFVLPDYHLAFDRLTYGSYWTVFDSLPDATRLQFSGAWGIAFEEYILGLIEHAYPRSSIVQNAFTRNVPFKGGEVDGLFNFGDHAILLEIKSSLLTVAVRSSRDVAIFEKWVTDRLCNSKQKGALAQLADAVNAATTGLIGGLPRVVYPVLVTDELSFQSLGINRYLATRFDKLIDNRNSIRPLTVITTDEIEELLSCVQDGLITWRAVLDRRAQDRDGWLWIGQTLRNELVATGRIDQVRRNEVLSAEYNSFLRDIGVKR